MNKFIFISKNSTNNNEHTFYAYIRKMRWNCKISAENKQTFSSEDQSNVEIYRFFVYISRFRAQITENVNFCKDIKSA